MSEARTFSAEMWVPDRDAFIFRIKDRRVGDLATFCVPGSTLHEYQPKDPFEPAAAFDALRPLIYRAALERIRTGSGAPQLVITPHELRVIERSMRTSRRDAVI